MSKYENVTPRPWIVKKHKSPADGLITARIGKKGGCSFRPVCKMQNTHQGENADYIVHCVNNHERLLAMLEEVVGQLERYGAGFGNTDQRMEEGLETSDKAKALINEIKETGQ